MSIGLNGVRLNKPGETEAKNGLGVIGGYRVLTSATGLIDNTDWLERQTDDR